MMSRTQEKRSLYLPLEKRGLHLRKSQWCYFLARSQMQEYQGGGGGGVGRMI